MLEQPLKFRLPVRVGGMPVRLDLVLYRDEGLGAVPLVKLAMTVGIRQIAAMGVIRARNIGPAIVIHPEIGISQRVGLLLDEHVGVIRLPDVRKPEKLTVF